MQNRREAEQNRITELKDRLTSVEVSSMELLDEEVVGIDSLRLVAEKLYGLPEKLPADLGPHEVGDMVKHEYSSRNISRD